MTTIEAQEHPPLSCELDEDQEIFQASAKDLDLALKVNSSIVKTPEGIYEDGEFYYYSIKLPIKRKRLGGGFVETQVWIRSTISYDPGSYWDPGSSEEVLVDGNLVFLSLSDAVKMSKLDSYRRELSEIDNTCYSCMGCGCDGFDEKTCNKCNGKGFIP